MSRILRILAILVALAFALSCGGGSSGTSESGGSAILSLAIDSPDASPDRAVARAVVGGFSIQSLTVDVTPQDPALGGAQTTDITSLLAGTSASVSIGGLSVGGIYNFTVSATDYHGAQLCSGSTSATILDGTATPVSLTCGRTAPVEGVYQFYLEGTGPYNLNAYDNASGTVTPVAANVVGAALNLDLDTMNAGFEPDGMNSAHVVFHDTSSVFYRADSTKAGSLAAVQFGDMATAIGVETVCEVRIMPNPGSPLDTVVIVSAEPSTCVNGANTTYAIPLGATAVTAPVNLGDHGEVYGSYDATGTVTTLFVLDNSGGNTSIYTCQPDLTGCTAPLVPAQPLGTLFAYPSEPAADGSTVMFVHDSSTDTQTIIRADGSTTAVAGIPAGMSWSHEHGESTGDYLLLPFDDGAGTQRFFSVNIDNGTAVDLGTVTNTGKDFVSFNEAIPAGNNVYWQVELFDNGLFLNNCQLVRTGLAATGTADVVSHFEHGTLECRDLIDIKASYGDTIYANLYDNATTNIIASTVDLTGVTPTTGQFVGFIDDGFRASGDVGTLLHDDGTGVLTLMDPVNPTETAVELNPGAPFTLSGSIDVEAFTVDTLGLVNLVTGTSSEAFLFEYPRGGSVIDLAAEPGVTGTSLRLIPAEDYGINDLGELMFHD